MIFWGQFCCREWNEQNNSYVCFVGKVCWKIARCRLLVSEGKVAIESMLHRLRSKFENTHGRNSPFRASNDKAKQEGNPSRKNKGPGFTHKTLRAQKPRSHDASVAF